MKLFTIATALLATALSTVHSLPVNDLNARSIIPGKHFDRVVIFIFENNDFSKVHADPFFGSLAKKYNGIELTNFAATTHPSQPNYIALIAGSQLEVDDNSEYNINSKSIVDLLEAKGISWKSYQESYTGNCNLAMSIGTYRRKHNPFISFSNVQKNPEWCSKIVSASQLKTDIANNQVPQFVFYTPDMKNSAHDTNIAYASNWFKNYLEGSDNIIQKPAFNKNTMFVSTWDEDSGSTPNKIQTVLFGPDFHKSTTATTDNTEYTHYSLLRTIEDNWDLGDLGQNDKSANLIKL
ncbi:phosphoesterase family-domain-containing protein [Cunninghamella echinulata]|nr:phosphoesterase family-domain-containing protein [Cunninghamella echinulata]